MVMMLDGRRGGERRYFFGALVAYVFTWLFLQAIHSIAHIPTLPEGSFGVLSLPVFQLMSLGTTLGVFVSGVVIAYQDLIGKAPKAPAQTGPPIAQGTNVVRLAHTKRK